jgi:hypothetical protein
MNNYHQTWAFKSLQYEKVISLQAWTGHYGSRRLRLPKYLYPCHKNRKRLSSLRTGRLYPQEISMLLISVSDGFDPRAMVGPDGLLQWKIPLIPSRIASVTFGLLTQFLDQLRQGVTSLQYIHYKIKGASAIQLYIPESPSLNLSTASLRTSVNSLHPFSQIQWWCLRALYFVFISVFINDCGKGCYTYNPSKWKRH